MNSTSTYLISRRKYKTEILAGLTVAMTMIPESLSFAILAGFPPLVVYMLLL
jgi:MFS superfamily sulfate permease-like transporter